jgi:hypothetical protein
MDIDIAIGQLKRTPILKVPTIIEIQGIPPNLSSDLKEAQLCHSIGANNACVIMCRRALEQLCIDKHANGHTLHQKLESLTEQGILSREIYEISTEIRYFGNFGAHPENDLFEGIVEHDAREVLEMCIYIAKHVYEVPLRVQQLRERRRGT